MNNYEGFSDLDPEICQWARKAERQIINQHRCARVLSMFRVAADWMIPSDLPIVMGPYGLITYIGSRTTPEDRPPDS